MLIKWQLGMSSGDTRKMEFDTGSAISTLPVQKYKDIFPNRPLIDTTTILKTYSEENIKLEGKLLARVEHSNQVKDLALCGVKIHNACIVWK